MKLFIKPTLFPLLFVVVLFGCPGKSDPDPVPPLPVGDPLERSKLIGLWDLEYASFCGKKVPKKFPPVGTSLIGNPVSIEQVGSAELEDNNSYKIKYDLKYAGISFLQQNSAINIGCDKSSFVVKDDSIKLMNYKDCPEPSGLDKNNAPDTLNFTGRMENDGTTLYTYLRGARGEATTRGDTAVYNTLAAILIITLGDEGQKACKEMSKDGKEEIYAAWRYKKK